MDRDLATKLVDTLADIKGDFDDIVTALETIATNTTPADEPAEQTSVNESRSGEEPEEPVEETRGGKK